MPTRWVHFRLDEAIHARVRAAAARDRRSLSNWVAMACEKALEAAEHAQDSADSGEVAR
jgi:predicted HicB family RNase H-like nuclease